MENALNWDAIGAVGEILGAIAVLGTLFYLAAQIKQNTVSTRTASELQVTRMEQDWMETWANDEELQLIWDRVANGEADESDKRRFIWKIAQFCAIAGGVFDQYQSGMVSEQCWKTLERNILGYLQYDFVRVWWERRDGGTSPALYDYIDKLALEEPTWLPRSTTSISRDA